MVLETGIDYYNFLRTVRIIGNKTKKNVESILQWLANEEAEREKQAQQKLEQKPFRMISNDNDDEEEDDDDSSSMISGADEDDENYDHFTDLQPKFDLKNLIVYLI